MAPVCDEHLLGESRDLVSHVTLRAVLLVRISELLWSSWNRARVGLLYYNMYIVVISNGACDMM